MASYPSTHTRCTCHRCVCPLKLRLPKSIHIQDNALVLWLLTFFSFKPHFHDKLFRSWLSLTRWRILVIRHLDFKLSEKQAEQTLATAWPPGPPRSPVLAKHRQRNIDFFFWCEIALFSIFSFSLRVTLFLERRRPLWIIRLRVETCWTSGS